MLMLPIKNRNGRDVLIVVLDSTNVERMKQADPVQIESFGGKMLVNPMVMICYEEDATELMGMINAGNLEKVINWLSRGFEFRPDLGDHDRGPEKLAIMGMLTIDIRGSFETVGCKKFPAQTSGHAVAVQDAIRYLESILPSAIQQDERLQAKGFAPDDNFKEAHVREILRKFLE